MNTKRTCTLLVAILCFLTNAHLYTVDLFDGNSATVDLPAHWRYLAFNSVVLLDGSLYIGSGYGIMEYEIEAAWRWYSIDSNQT